MRKELKHGILQKMILCGLSVLLLVLLILGPVSGNGLHVQGKDKPELTEASNVNNNGYDVVYVVDNSKSVWDQQAARNQALRNITHLAVGSDVKIGVVFFADHVYKSQDLVSVETEKGSRQVLDFLNMTDQDNANIDTNIGNGLQVAAEYLKNKDPNRKRIVILFSDGINENLAEDTAYVESANSNTRTQAGVLKNLNASIYCVYLQKLRNDEEYLKQIVNYFSEENSYDSERFYTVQESNIGDLSERFADIFYDMQNNMKYQEIKLDSSGTMTFYVPKMGVKKLQIYLNGNIQKGTLYPAEESKYEDWSDGTARFLVYKNPGDGDWSIKVSSTDQDSVHGRIAYYADLQASAELTAADKDTKYGKKGKYTLRIRFYDTEGKQVEVDETASAQASVVFEDDGKTVKTKMKIEDGEAVSEPFTLDSYGKFNYSVGLKYEDYLDLQYTITGGKITRTAPQAKNISNHLFIASDEDGKYRFNIEEDSLFHDPEGEKVTVDPAVTLKNRENPVQIRQIDGQIEVSAEKAKLSPVNFKLHLTDESGMSSDVTVKGIVINRMWIVIAVVIVAVILLVILCFIFRRIRRNKITDEYLREKLSRFEQLKSDLEEKYEEFQKEVTPVENSRDDFRYVLNGDNDTPGLYKIAEKVPEELHDILGIDQYLKPDFETNCFADADSIITNISDPQSMIALMTTTADRLKKRLKKGNVKISENVEQWIKKIGELEKLKNDLDQACKSLPVLSTQLEEYIEQIANEVSAAGRMIDQEIACTLVIRSIEEIEGVQGIKSCTDITMRHIRGYYKLDDVYTSPGPESLKKHVGETGIYVFAYTSDDGKVGLELMSSREFICSQSGTSREAEGCRRAVLLKGMEYELVLINGRRRIHMRLSVQ